MAAKKRRTQISRKGQSLVKKRQNFSKEKKSRQKLVQTVQSKKKMSVREGVLLLFIGVCIVVLLQIQSHRVDGQSMLPILKNNDRIIVRKNQSPNRYDMVTFDPEIQGESSYVKRIIGMPGDQLWTDQTGVYLRTKQADAWNQENNQKLSSIQLPDSTLKVTVSEEVARNLRDTQIIPQGSYFVLGDNRAASKDSRYFGLIKSDQIEGVVIYRIYPFNRMGRIN